MTTKNLGDASFHNNPAKDFFLYLVLFLSLAFIAFGEGAIFFQLINKFAADPLEATLSFFDQGPVKFGIAAILIAGPIFFFLSRVVNDRLKNKKTPPESSVRKWLTYILLFFAAAIIIGDLIALVMNFLNGDAPGAFLLKVLVVLVISGAILGYYFWNMRSLANKKTKDRINLYIAYGLAAVLAVTFIAAFFVVDSPKISKQKRIDLQTVSNLQNVDVSVRGYFEKTGKLPRKLDELGKTGLVQGMPKSSTNVSYEILAGNEYKLCADFQRSNRSDDDLQTSYVSGEWRHGAGKVCFDRIALELVKQ